MKRGKYKRGVKGIWVGRSAARYKYEGLGGNGAGGEVVWIWIWMVGVLDAGGGGGVGKQGWEGRELGRGGRRRGGG